MNHEEIFKYFILYFPDYGWNKLETWFPNGKNSIRIRLKNNQDFIFTYFDMDRFTFETLDNFLERLRGKKCSNM